MEYLNGALFMSSPSLLANIGQGLKCLALANIPAHNTPVLITAVKSFKVQALGVKAMKLFFFVTDVMKEISNDLYYKYIMIVI